MKFDWKKTFVLGFGFLGISVIWPLFNSLIPPFLEDLGLSAIVVGFILTWDNLINMFVQPLVGARSDRTRSRWGRRKPWLMAGAPLAAVFFILVPFVRTNFALIALAILGTNIGMALFRSPTVAYLGDLYPAEQRSKANGVINLMGGVGGAIALLGGGALFKLGVPLPFIVGALLLLIAIGVVLAFVREPAAPEAANEVTEPGVWDSLRDVSRGDNPNGMYILLAIFCWFIAWNAVEAFFTVYVRNILGIAVGSGTQMLTAFAAMLILFAIPSGLIATRIGRKPTIMVGLIGMTVGLILALVLTNTLQLLVLLALMGGFWALVNINSLPMVYDVGGNHSIGALTGLYYFASSLAAITGPIVAGGLIDLTSHRAIWPFAAVFMLLALVMMSRIKTAAPTP
jgi:MFS family permease